MSEDPIGFSGNDSNFYRYAFNNPILLNDLSGLIVYECKRPLKGLDKMIGPLNHTFLCVNGYCNGQTSASGTISSATFTMAGTGGGCFCPGKECKP